jgi:hypothetical protein
VEVGFRMPDSRCRAATRRHSEPYEWASQQAAGYFGHGPSPTLTLAPPARSGFPASTRSAQSK